MLRLPTEAFHVPDCENVAAQQHKSNACKQTQPDETSSCKQNIRNHSMHMYVHSTLYLTGAAGAVSVLPYGAINISASAAWSYIISATNSGSELSTSMNRSTQNWPNHPPLPKT